VRAVLGDRRRSACAGNRVFYTEILAPRWLGGAGAPQKPAGAAPCLKSDGESTQYYLHRFWQTTEDVLGRDFPTAVGREYVPPKLVSFKTLDASACGGRSGDGPVTVLPMNKCLL